MKRSARGSKRFLLLALLLLLLAGAGVAWAERTTLLGWYYLRGLEKAGSADVSVWSRRAASLGEAGIPDLLRLLGSGDARVCGNAREALACLGEGWGRDDPRRADLLGQVATEFSRLSGPGRREALRLATDWTVPEPPCPDALIAAAGRLLPEIVHEADLHTQALPLALCIARQSQEPALLCSVRELARGCLRSSAVDTRVRAIRLSLQPGVRLGRDVVALLGDANAKVRRAALEAVGPARDVVHTDTLLPWLHDPDPGVRQVCATVLGQRGLKPRHIRLARLITDPQASVRLQTLDHLAAADDLDAGIWLRRLSQDVSPAVRVAAIRAASEDALADLGDRIDQMARQDPSPTVCALARYYRQRQRPGAPMELVGERGQ